jgi:hypothetical protein
MFLNELIMEILKANGDLIPEEVKLNKFYLKSILRIALQLLAIAFITSAFELEQSLNLYKLTLFVGIGFVLHLFVPHRYKVYFFSVLGMLAAMYFTGYSNGLLIIFYGLIMVSSASLIANRGLRYIVVGLLFALLIGLFAMKSEWVRDHFIVFSVLGSMFMFRLSLFLYEKHHNPEAGRFIDDIAYFFMIPNMAITLFPVVDYRAFKEKTKSSEMWNTYKKGVQWMVLGVFHLLIYRLIYYYFYIPNEEVSDLFSFGHYAVTNYLLIIRLSGIFHFGVGVLCMFGFNLPSVFNNYFLASGFSDLWRRINIYYRDYVIKVFYYPLFFRFRKFGMIKAQIISILLIFALTWLLHSFQWFWLKGKFAVRLVDIIYWGTFGVLVAMNTVFEMKKNRNAPSNDSRWWISFKASGQILFMFLCMSFLWSLWSARSLGDWMATLAPVFRSDVKQYVIAIGALGAAWFAAVILHRLIVSYKLGNQINPAPESKMATFWSFAMLCGILLLKVGPVKQVVEHRMNVDLSGLLSPKLKDADQHLMIEGYYEEILIGNELTSPVGTLQDPENQRFVDSEAAEIVSDIRNTIHKPNVAIIFKDNPYTTNKWRMRDRNYELKPKENTIRMGFTGGSFVVGVGVSDDEVFNRILDQKMNSLSKEYRYEFLNFGNSGYDLIQCLFDLESQNRMDFDLDYMVYVSHGIDIHKNLRLVIARHAHQPVLPFDFLNDIIKKSGVTGDMSEVEKMRLIEPFGKELIERAYAYFGNMCKENGVKPVWLYWPTVISFIDQSKYLKSIAEENDYLVIDLEHFFDSYDRESLVVSSDDIHPNAMAHRLVAQELTRIFTDEIKLTKKRVKQ